MIIISGHSNIALAQQIAGLISAPLVIAECQKFAADEMRIHINAELKGRNVAIVQSISRPTHDHLLELLLLLDTAAKMQAQTITAVIPYLCYARQDRPTHNEPAAAHLIIKLIEATGVNKVVTLELHSQRVASLFSVPAVNIDSTTLFAPYFTDINDITVIAPDFGGIARAKRLANALQAPVTLLDKDRHRTPPMEMVFGNTHGRHCIICDDIIDTGFTMQQAAQVLRNNGATAVSACATHTVLSPGCAMRMQNSGIEGVYVTNSIAPIKLYNNVHIVSAAGLIARALQTNTTG
ncbi:MAG: ribose-phosphate pyrophosphokinase [Proteobacteria bacterium]|nr:ribose-phosphate pyrophosphokinase [Pseudomonadota bacterium]